jgi:hypothetical protein
VYSGEIRMSTLSPVKIKQSGTNNSSSKTKTPAPINWTPKVPAATDFIGFCNSLDIVVQATREGVRVPELRPARSSQQKGFMENLTSWVETYKNTEETLGKDKTKLKEMPDDDNDDMMSKLNETQSVAQTNKKSTAGGPGASGPKKGPVQDSMIGIDGNPATLTYREVHIF